MDAARSERHRVSDQYEKRVIDDERVRLPFARLCGSALCQRQFSDWMPRSWPRRFHQPRRHRDCFPALSLSVLCSFTCVYDDPED